MAGGCWLRLPHSSSSSSQLRLCWNEVSGHSKEHSGRESAGSKGESPSAWTTSVPHLPPLGASPWFVADSPGTYPHVMDHLRAREMGESLPSSSSACGLLPAVAVPWCLQGPGAGCRAEMLLPHLWELMRIGWRAGQQLHLQTPCAGLSPPYHCFSQEQRGLSLNLVPNPS